MSTFYEDLAPFFHLIYTDWDAAIEGQRRMLARIVESEWGADRRRVLDVACGIGTQSLALKVVSAAVGQIGISRSRHAR